MLKFNSFFVVLLVSAAFTPLTASATTCASYPYTFTNGTTADANQMMSNLNYLSSCTAPSVSPSFTGFVGIGTASPQASLQVIGGVATTGGCMSFQNNSLNIDYCSAAGGARLQAFNNPLLLNPYGGNVGIDTTSPSYTLHVNGSVAGTSAYVNLSDARYKKNVAPLDNGLDIVLQLKPVSFEWKDEVLQQAKTDPKAKEHHRTLDASMQGKQIGFIAQDVEKILPSVVVTETNDDKTKGMKYSEMIPVLVKAIQEQQKEIDELKKAK